MSRAILSQKRARRNRQLEAAMLLNRLALIERLAAQPAPSTSSGQAQPLAERVGAMLRRNRNSQPIPFNGEPVPYESDDTQDTGLESPL